jgi:hypothetical protein
MTQINQRSESSSAGWSRAREYQLLTASAMGLLVAGTVIYRWLEDWSWVDALYFSVVTATTVGFGDLHPTTDEAKLFTVVYVFLSVGIIGAFINARVRRRERALRRRGQTTD